MKLQLGMQIFAVILYILPAVASMLIIPVPVSIIMAILSLILIWLSLSKGKLPTFFLIAIPGVFIVLAGFLHMYAQNINNTGEGQGAGLVAAIVDVTSIYVLIYSMSTGLGSVLALLVRSIDRQRAERGSNDRE
ncbi:MAG: hypothetical protein ACYDCO_20310 [Armatimonadota bacterium]